MQLPRGTLEKSFRGPGTLASVTDGIGRDSLTGYLRVSILSDNATEYVTVYLSGKPVMAFVSAGGDDLPDRGMAGITASIQQADCIIEICRLGDKQVSLLQELYGNLVYRELPPPPKPVEKPAPRQAPLSAAARTAPAPQDRTTTNTPVPRPASRFIKPEIRGRFIRSEELGDIREYVDRYPEDTGHLLFVMRQNGTQEECHAIISGGRLEAVYDDNSIVAGMPDWLAGVHGIAEFYAIDAGTLASVLQRTLKTIPGTSSSEPSVSAPQPAVAARPAVSPAAPAAKPAEPYAPPAVVRPAVNTAVPERPAETARVEPAANRPRGIGVSATSVLEKSRSHEPVPAEEDISRTVDEISKSMDDDLAMVRKVEQDFAMHADELLEKLELGHLRRDRKKKEHK